MFYYVQDGVAPEIEEYFAQYIPGYNSKYYKNYWNDCIESVSLIDDGKNTGHRIYKVVLNPDIHGDNFMIGCFSVTTKNGKSIGLDYLEATIKNNNLYTDYYALYTENGQFISLSPYDSNNVLENCNATVFGIDDAYRPVSSAKFVKVFAPSN